MGGGEVSRPPPVGCLACLKAVCLFCKPLLIASHRDASSRENGDPTPTPQASLQPDLSRTVPDTSPAGQSSPWSNNPPVRHFDSTPSPHSLSQSAAFFNLTCLLRGSLTVHTSIRHMCLLMHQFGMI